MCGHGQSESDGKGRGGMRQRVHYGVRIRGSFHPPKAVAQVRSVVLVGTFPPQTVGQVAIEMENGKVCSGARYLPRRSKTGA